jgi:predicted metal-dependent hydrolase
LSKKYKVVAKERFENFYRLEAKKYIPNRVKEIAQKNKIKFNRVTITSAKTRWGSCTSTSNLNFSYRLIMAPLKTIDYVIVHELAHLKEMNHSKKFRNLVEKMMLDLYP